MLSTSEIDSDRVLPQVAPLRVVAFYLPQFHPTPQNDAWWGKGFTEWTNVAKAQPLFDGHHQPHLPTDFGFYDLRVGETRREQIRVAKHFGVDAFCYHYYWFSGERLLHRPLDDMLADPSSDMPFCLCWANESWTRRWDAADHTVLIEQKYLPEDDLKFIQDTAVMFKDSRYLRVDGKPFLIVYRPQHMPNAARSAEVWRNYCRQIGLGEIHLCSALTHGNDDYEAFGFDSGVEFPPHNMRVPSLAAEINFHAPFYGYAMQYAEVANAFLNRTYAQGARIFKTVFPAWDNTARTGARAVVVLNGTPRNFAHWFARTLAKAQEQARKDSPVQDQLVFINAWNEWAEGCHLEPDRKYGLGYLEALRDVRSGHHVSTDFADTRLPNSSQEPRRLFNDLAMVLHYHVGRLLGATRNRVNRFPLARAALMPIIKLIKRVWH
jgi:lipopolysaccharide biosynthesis protein